MLNTVAKDVEDVSSLVWFRNDLRVSDHTGLTKASKIQKGCLGYIVLIQNFLLIINLDFQK